MKTLLRLVAPPSGVDDFRRLIACLLLLAGSLAQAAPGDVTQPGEKQPLHWSAEKTIWDRRENRVTLSGSAVVNQPGETIEADDIVLDLKNRTIDATGKCVYRANETLIEARELHFNLDTRTGTIVEGKVTNGGFVLVGERINKLGDGRFQTHQAEYTTCQDCPGSWSFSGEDVDLQFEGYAYMSDVTARVMGAPVLWIPYLVFPVKQKRQSGLLFPKIGRSQLHGFRFVIPFYWATSRSTDMTFGLGTFTERGFRGEWEGRYVFSKDSGGQINFGLTRDTTADAPAPWRWGLGVVQEHRLPFGIQEKLKLYEVRDNLYPVQFAEEDSIPGRYEPALASDLIFSHQTNQVSSYLLFRRFRNLLDFEDPTRFDHKTVQLFPRYEMTTNDRRVFGTPVAVGLNFGVSNFTRAAGPFDYAFCEPVGDPSCDRTGDPFVPGEDPIREATRISLTPGLYAPMRLFDVVSFIPSAQYKSYYYSFHEALPSLSRGYLHLRADLSVDFEKVYETSNPDIPKVKHVIRPLLSYSRIPFVQEPSHPFLDQIQQNGNAFDNEDIVPIGTSPSLVNYFVPQGHSLSYGVSTQLVRRRGDIGDNSPVYQRFVELTLGQSINILEYKKDKDERVPFSRFEASFDLDLDRFDFNSQYWYYPSLNRLLGIENDDDAPSPHVVSSSLSYSLEKSLHQKVLSFERSLTLSHTWNRVNARTHHLGAALTYSLNDYWMPSVSAAYDVLTTTFKEASFHIAYQNASRCWKIMVGVKRTLDRGNETLFDFNINLTGEGFGAITDFVGGIVN